MLPECWCSQSAGDTRVLVLPSDTTVHNDNDDNDNDNRFIKHKCSNELL